MSNNQDDLNRKLNYLNETKQEIKRSLKAKGQPVNDNTTFREYANLVNNITTGTDTQDADATPNDILSPKTAYVKGQKITGNILSTYKPVNDYIESEITNCASYTCCEYLSREDVYLFGNGQSYTIQTNTGTTHNEFPDDIQGNILRISSCYINNHTIIAALFVNGSSRSSIHFYELINDVLELTDVEMLSYSTSGFYEDQMTFRISRDGKYMAYTIRNRANGSNYYFYKLDYDTQFSVQLTSSGVIGSGEIDFYTGKWSNDNSKYVITGSDYNNTAIFELSNGSVTSTATTGSLIYFDFYNNNTVCYINRTSSTLYFANYAWPFDFTNLFSVNTGLSNWRDIFILGNYCICYGQTKIKVYKINTTSFELILEQDSYYASKIEYNQITDNIYACYRNNNEFIIKYYNNTNLINTVTIDNNILYNLSDSSINSNDVISEKIFYNQTGKHLGTMPNNGELNYTPSDNEQIIPEGYTSGGTIKAIDVTQTQYYEECLELSNQILGN